MEIAHIGVEAPASQRGEEFHAEDVTEAHRTGLDSSDPDHHIEPPVGQRPIQRDKVGEIIGGMPRFPLAVSAMILYGWIKFLQGG